MTLADFEKKLLEYSTNNITALEGNVQLTSNERSELQLLFKELAAPDKQKAADLLKARGVDASGWK